MFNIDSELYKEAENILNTLNLPMDTAITLFLRQVVLHNGLPFSVVLPDTKHEATAEDPPANESYDWMGDLFSELLKETEAIKEECASDIEE